MVCGQPLSKGAEPYFGNPNAVALATEQGNTQLIDLFSQSQLDSESQEAQATPLSSEQDFEESDDEFYAAEEGIVQSGDQKNPEPESASSQQTEKNVLSSTKESDTINNVGGSIHEFISNGYKGDEVPVDKKKESSSLAEKDTQIAKLEEELEIAQQNLVKKTDELKSKEVDLENNKKELGNANRKVSQLQEKLKQEKQKINNLTSRVDQLNEEKSALGSQLAKKEKELKDVQVQLEQEKTLDVAKGNVSQLKEELNQAQQNLAAKTEGFESAEIQLKRLQKDLDKKTGEESQIQSLQKQLESKNKELNGKNEKFLGASIHSRRQGNYASVSFVLSGAFAVGASLTMFHLAMCISLAVAALTFLAVGCYCSYKANTALSDVESDQIANDVHVVA